MKESYLTKAFRKTAREKFPELEAVLNFAFEKRLGELCHCFCDSDDITYDGLHPKLVWHRTKTLGRGDDRCDFCMKIMK